MRLWSLHPRYLDPKGLVALWREALLAQAVLSGKTRGYQSHPQLQRFREQTSPIDAIGAFLAAIYMEATARNYSFDRRKIARAPSNLMGTIPVTVGQIELEWHHLLVKLANRSPDFQRALVNIALPECHPLFRLTPGGVATWERGKA